MAEPDHPSRPDNGIAVSVIVCTFNRETLLPGALESLARQSADTSRYEIVIVNNNATDRTDRLCRTFVESHPTLNTTYVTEPRQGLSHARNRGIAEAKGRFITYIDDDAIATPEFVEKISAFFRRHEDAAAVGGRVLATFEEIDQAGSTGSALARSSVITIADVSRFVSRAAGAIPLAAT